MKKTSVKKGLKKPFVLSRRNKLILSAVAFFSLTVGGALAATYLTQQNQDKRVDASASCTRPVLKQIIWRSGKEWWRYIPIANDGKVSWGSSLAWTDNSEHSPYQNVTAVSHYKDVQNRWLTKFVFMRNGSEAQTAKFFRPRMEGEIVKWNNAPANNLDVSSYPANMVALSSVLYGQDIVYKAIAYTDNTPYAYVRTVKHTSNGNYDWGGSRFERNALEHFPGSGMITAFTEEFYNGFLTQKLVRDGNIYVREVPLTNGKPNFAASASEWKLATSLANSQWPGTGTVDAISEYVDCAQ